MIREIYRYGYYFESLFCKSILFWIAGIINVDEIKKWSIIRKKPILLVLFWNSSFCISRISPVSFIFREMELIMLLAESKLFIWSGIILLASFIEGIYLFRWFGYALKLDHKEQQEFKIPFNRILPPIIFAILLYAGGYYASTLLDTAKGLNYIPLLFIAFIALIDVFPAWVKNTFPLQALLYIVFIFFLAWKGIFSG